MIKNSAAEMAQSLASGATTSVALTQAHLDRIADVDAKVRAFLHVDTEGALKQAADADAARARGDGAARASTRGPGSGHGCRW